jgi:hypothetical protein
VALAIAFFSKSTGRTFMGRLFFGGFCLLLLAVFLKVISRLI